MEKRNFNILIVSLITGITLFWLSVYNIVQLDIDYGQYLQDQFTDPDELDITIKGNGVTREITLRVAELKSDRYNQVINRQFHFINAVGRRFDKIYSGVSLWSILIVENILKPSASTFIFIGRDGYHSEKPLSLRLVEENPEDVILAYEEDGHPLFNDGPIRSVVDYYVIPDEITTRFWIQNLRYIQID